MYGEAVYLIGTSPADSIAEWLITTESLMKFQKT